jgi:diketogulonate reductase-like aldo/keto reductase
MQSAVRGAAPFPSDSIEDHRAEPARLERKRSEKMNKHLLNRRQFNARCAALGLALPAANALFAEPAVAQASGAGKESKAGAHAVKLPDGTSVAALGQGCWHLGQGRHPDAVETEAIRTGISMGMTLIDTSGNYGNGLSEKFLGRALAGQRDHIYLVTKVEADEVDGDGIERACQASLTRLATDHVDLYLMHSPIPVPKFAAMVAAFEKLRAAGKIRAWGVSNFNREQMEALVRVSEGQRCATNQVNYSLNVRGIERDLLPWCREHNMPVMAYSPLGGDNSALTKDSALMQIGAAHGCSASAVALAWAMRSGSVIAIPESGSPGHVKENAAALSVALAPDDLKRLNAAHPGPSGAA